MAYTIVDRVVCECARSEYGRKLIKKFLERNGRKVTIEDMPNAYVYKMDSYGTTDTKDWKWAKTNGFTVPIAIQKGINHITVNPLSTVIPQNGDSPQDNNEIVEMRDYISHDIPSLVREQKLVSLLN